MLRKFTMGLWFAALLAGAGWLLWRNQELEGVRRSNTAVRGQVAAGNEPAASRSARLPASADTPAGTPGSQASAVAGSSPTASPSNGNPSSPAAPLTSGERDELLKLRGQVSLLRREVAAATRRQSSRNWSAAASGQTNRPAGPTPSVYLPTQDYGPGLLAAASEINNLIYKHAEQHGGQVPANLPPEVVSQLGSDATELLGRLELLPGETITPETDCCIFTAREREARQTPDGSWVRLYLRASGGFIVAGPFTDPDWERWERQQLGRLRESLRRRMQPPAP